MGEPYIGWIEPDVDLWPARSPLKSESEYDWRGTLVSVAVFRYRGEWYRIPIYFVFWR